MANKQSKKQTVNNTKSIGLNRKVYQSFVNNKVVKSFINQKTPAAQIFTFLVQDALKWEDNALKGIIQSGVDSTINGKKDEQIAKLEAQIKELRESKVKS